MFSSISHIQTEIHKSVRQTVYSVSRRCSSNVLKSSLVLFALLSIFLCNTGDRNYGTVDMHSRHISSTGYPLDFQDQSLLPLLDSYQYKVSIKSIRNERYRSGPIPKVVAYVDSVFVKRHWFGSHMRHITDGMCPLPCIVTTNISEVASADAVLIHLKSVRSREELLAALQPRDLAQPWIMFEVETHFFASSKYHVDYKSLNGIFNRTMYYRRDADIRFLHGFVVRRGRQADLFPAEWVRKPQFRRRNVTRRAAVAFISNCKAKSGRLTYIKELQRSIAVDVYGRCGTLDCGTSRYAQHEYRVDKELCLYLAAEKYLFYLAFENAICDDYATEKLYNLMYYPLVPVVLGGADYSAILPPNSYIDARLYTPDELAAKLQHLADHPKEYMKYLEWREYYQPSTVGGTPVFCDLCKRLHDKDFYEKKIIHDFYDWFVTGSHCSNITGP